MHLDACGRLAAMRTTIRLDDELLTEVKAVAAKSGKTLNEVVADSLRETLARRKAMAGRKRVELPVFRGGGGVMPGVDLNNSAALLDLMDGLDDRP